MSCERCKSLEKIIKFQTESERELEKKIKQLGEEIARLNTKLKDNKIKP